MTTQEFAKYLKSHNLTTYEIVQDWPNEVATLEEHFLKLVATLEQHCHELAGLADLQSPQPIPPYPIYPSITITKSKL